MDTSSVGEELGLTVGSDSNPNGGNQIPSVGAVDGTSVGIFDGPSVGLDEGLNDGDTDG